MRARTPSFQKMSQKAVRLKIGTQLLIKITWICIKILTLIRQPLMFISLVTLKISNLVMKERAF